MGGEDEVSCHCCGALVSPRPWWTRNRRRFAYCERCYRGECEKCKVPTPEERAPSSLPAGGKRERLEDEKEAALQLLSYFLASYTEEQKRGLACLFPWAWGLVGEQIPTLEGED